MTTQPTLTDMEKRWRDKSAFIEAPFMNSADCADELASFRKRLEEEIDTLFNSGGYYVETLKSMQRLRALIGGTLEER